MTRKPTNRWIVSVLSVLPLFIGLSAGLLTVQQRREHLQNALIHAVMQEDAETVRNLLAQGVDPNAVWSEDAKPAIFTDIFWEGGSGSRRASKHRFSALMGASAHCNMEITTLLLDAGADVNARSANGYTPVFYAAYNNPFYAKEFFIIFLIERGADIEATNPAGRKVWQLLHMDPVTLRYLQQEALLKSRVRSETNNDVRAR